MNYLKVKIYFKSRFNFLILIFFLKWCVLFLIFYEFMKLVTKTTYHIILIKTEESNLSHHQLMPNTRSNLVETPLILLWNKYQLTGSKVYDTIFERVTSGQCQVGA